MTAQPMASTTTQLSPSWENYKSEITELYKSKTSTLQKVRDEMQRRHGFTATLKQWKNQLARWNLKKNIHPAEYIAMSRKRKEREEIEGKATQFFIDGVEVPPEKIARYECRKERNKRLEDGPDDAATPPGLTCGTPPILENDGLVTRSGVNSLLEPFDEDENLDNALTTALWASTNYASPHGLFSSETIAMPWQLQSAKDIPPTPASDPFDWFNAYIEYAESIRSSPPPSESPLTQLLSRFARTLDNYDERVRCQLRFGRVQVPLPGEVVRQKRNVVFMLAHHLSRSPYSRTNSTGTRKFEMWAQDLIDKVIRCYPNDDRFMAKLGLLVGNLYFAQGDTYTAKIYMDHVILEMQRVGGQPKERVIATQIVAAYYFVSGCDQRAEKLKEMYSSVERSLRSR